ncbi:MAG: RNA helicase [Bacteroidetes bacterium B1(2017)]|nr:MAG: RNA helicase [Bacteroidetes bacterium B1(2017)]
MDFLSLGLSPTLVKALREENILEPYPIQKQTIPAILSKQDVLGIAKTGSGKTASYVLPLLQMRQGKLVQSRHIAALVLVPTRELAVQVQGVFTQLGRFEPKPVKTLAVYGGVSINPQMLAMQGVQILIATPGRLLELIECNAVQLASVETLVLDEADKMLNLGFEEEIKKVLSKLPTKRQNILFSATLNEQAGNADLLKLNNPIVFNAEENATENIELITHSAFSLKNEMKGPLLRKLLKENIDKQVLVFASTVYQVDNITDKLLKNGFDAMSIHSKKTQGARTEAINKFKKGSLKVLVATDLLARGIDIQLLPMVINYELPRSPKDYIHRVGRTGRADSFGEAISFITEADEAHFKVIQKKIGKVIPLEPAKI